MSIVKDIKRNELSVNLDLGAIVHISNNDSSLKYRTSLIGYDPGQGTLITALPNPKQIGGENLTNAKCFKEQQQLVIRLIKSGYVYAFQSLVLTTHTEYCNILLSSLPDSIQARPLRGTVRYPCVLKAGFIIGETKYRGAITNISKTGCLLRMKSISNTAQLESMKTNKQISRIEINFPFNQGAQTLEASVKSCAKDSDDYLLIGMSFSGDMSLVHRYIESMQLEELTEFLPFRD